MMPILSHVPSTRMLAIENDYQRLVKYIFFFEKSYQNTPLRYRDRCGEFHNPFLTISRRKIKKFQKNFQIGHFNFRPFPIDEQFKTGLFIYFFILTLPGVFVSNFQVFLLKILHDISRRQQSFRTFRRVSLNTGHLEVFNEVPSKFNTKEEYSFEIWN